MIYVLLYSENILRRGYNTFVHLLSIAFKNSQEKEDEELELIFGCLYAHSFVYPDEILYVY